MYSRCVARDFIMTSFRFLTRSDRRSPPIYGKIARPVQRGVFLSATGHPIAVLPHPGALSTIVRYALKRAGLQPAPQGNPSPATLSGDRNAPPRCIHGRDRSISSAIASPNSTEIYAKVDMMGLRSLALPWPGKGGASMSTLRDDLRKYLELRRNLGFKLQKAGSALRSFVAFAEREGASYITTNLAIRWTKESRQVQPATWAARLCMVRRFAVWLSATDQRTEVPPVGLLPHRYHRRRPYIYSDAEIDKLVRAASRLPSPRGLNGLHVLDHFWAPVGHRHAH